MSAPASESDETGCDEGGKFWGGTRGRSGETYVRGTGVREVGGWGRCVCKGSGRVCEGKERGSGGKRQCEFMTNHAERKYITISAMNTYIHNKNQDRIGALV